MPIRFESIPFQELEKARLNWTSIQRTAPAELIPTFLALLRNSPDPDLALNYFERFNINASVRTMQYLARNLGALNILVPLFSQSHFLSETLLLFPEYAEWLYRDKRIEFAKSKEDLLEELSRFESTLGDAPLEERLARFKRQQYLRIALRDVSRIVTLAETTWELSTLADVLLEKALAIADQKLRNRYGSPQSMDGAGKIIAASFVVISLGKLGGNELNYSSDIDLLYLYSSEGETEGMASGIDSRISNQEYFIKLSSAVTEAVSRVTPVGWSFRVDLRLRPQGREGFLARSLPSAIEYYQQKAEPWELQTLLKARPVAGDLGLGRHLLRALQSRIYPREEKGRIFESINRMRSKLDVKLQTSETEGFNVKLERGTIRDIEFITQCLQRIYGAEDPWVREGNTLLALRRLHDNNYLARPEYVSLASAYEFFRIIEHRLQLDRGQQTHTIPALEWEQERLALRVGFERTKTVTSREALLHAIEYHRTAVNRIYQQLVEEGSEAALRERGTFSQGVAPESIEQELQTNKIPEGVLNKLKDRNPEFAAASAGVEIGEAWRPRFHSFLEAVSDQDELLRTIPAGPRWVEFLEMVFSCGPILAETAVRHPEWLISAFSTTEGRISAPKRMASAGRQSRGAAQRPGRCKPRPSARDSAGSPLRVNTLRNEVRHKVSLALADDVVSRVPLSRTLDRLSVIAQEAVASSYTLALDQVCRRASAAGRSVLKNRHFHFGIFGLGRIATRELDVGSDLDLLFVSDYSYYKSREVVRELAFRLAETVVSILHSYTREGALYQVDLRLRPSGSEGELVQDASHLLEYFHSAAQSWEYAAYLKLRPLAGDQEWARSLCQKLANVCRGTARAPLIRSGLLDIRGRLEQAVEAPEGGFDMKQSPGGMYDIDFALAYAHLNEGKRYRSGSTTLQALQGAERLRILEKSSVDVFVPATRFYRTLDHSVRMALGKPGRVVQQKLLEEIPIALLVRIALAGGIDQSSAASSPSPMAAGVMRTCHHWSSTVRKEMEIVFSI